MATGQIEPNQPNRRERIELVGGRFDGSTEFPNYPERMYINVRNPSKEYPYRVERYERVEGSNLFEFARTITQHKPLIDNDENRECGGKDAEEPKV